MLLGTAHSRLNLGSATASRPYPAFAFIRVDSRGKISPGLDGFEIYKMRAFLFGVKTLKNLSWQEVL